jgi:hypothetical protein
MPAFRNRQGQPIPITEWMSLVDNPEYAIVARFESGNVQLITCWNGLPFRLFFSRIIVNSVIAYEHSWPTEQQALAAHEALTIAFEANIDFFIAFRSLCQTHMPGGLN